MRALLSLALLIAANAWAATPFDGTWKTRVDSIRTSGKPQAFAISNGLYSCSSCAPPYTIQADGTDQPVAGHPYMDHVAVRILSPSSIELLQKKDGQLTSRQVESVSADGVTLTVRFDSYSGQRLTVGTRTARRVASGPVGSHATSGQWQQASDTASAERTVSLVSIPNGLKMVWNDGQTRTATFDGSSRRTAGDAGETVASFRRADDRSFEERDSRSGQAMDIVVWTLTADGKAIRVTDTDLQHGRTTTWLMEKQR